MDNGCGHHFTAACFIYIWRALAFSFLIFCSIIEWFHIKPTRYHQCQGFLLVLISNTPTTKGGPLSARCFVATNVRVYLACIVYCQIQKIEEYLINKPSILASRYNSRILTFSGLKLEKLKGSLGKSSLVQICRLHFLQSLNWNDVLKINALTYLSNLSTISHLFQISFPYYCKDCKLAST